MITTEELTRKLNQLSELQAQKTDALKPVEELRQQLESKIQPVNDMIAQLEQEILQDSKSLMSSAASADKKTSVVYVNPHVKHTWSTKDLNDVFDNDKELWRRISPYRSEVQVQATAYMKYK